MEEYGDQCKGQYNIRVAVFMISVITLLFDCFKMCRIDKRNHELEYENRSLKIQLLKRIDNTFINIIKNGNHSEYDHEE